MEKTSAFVLSLFITILIATNLSFFKYKTPELETVVISRIIDGDTLELKDGRIVRLNNINTPEKNTPNYDLSVQYLKQFLNKSVQLEVLGTEKYGRTLAKVYTPTYLNLELVELGLASKFLVSKSELGAFAKAEEKAIKSSLGIWKKSQYFNCFKTKIEEKQEKVLLKSNCNDININSWILKDESRKTYKFHEITLDQIKLHTHNGTDNQTDIFWNSKTNIWNNDHDSLYLFDSEGKLAHYETYGY